MDISTNQRVLQLIAKTCSTDKDFAKQIGIKQQNITQWKENSLFVSPRILCKVVKQFPFINARWLITGEGEMCSNEVSQIDSNEKTNTIMESTNSYKTENEILKDRIIYLEKALEEKDLLLSTKDSRIDELLKTIIEKLNS